MPHCLQCIIDYFKFRILCRYTKNRGRFEAAKNVSEEPIFMSTQHGVRLRQNSTTSTGFHRLPEIAKLHETGHKLTTDVADEGRCKRESIAVSQIYTTSHSWQLQDRHGHTCPCSVDEVVKPSSSTRDSAVKPPGD